MLEGGNNASSDFAVFFLFTDVSTDQLPDGVARGTLKFHDPSVQKTTPRKSFAYSASFASDAEGALILIGTDPNFKEGRATAFQACNGNLAGQRLFHTCDTLYGASSSVLLGFEERQLVVFGLHTNGEEVVGLDPVEAHRWNSGLQIMVARDFLEANGHTLE